MKRVHIHIAVDELAASINFYSTIFGTEPTVKHEDYAKWKIDDPAVNFAISNRGRSSGINHLGIQVDTEDELGEIAKRLKQSGLEVEDQENTTCCYANSNKHWTLDPQGIPWEAFLTLSETPVYGIDTQIGDAEKQAVCCIQSDS